MPSSKGDSAQGTKERYEKTFSWVLVLIAGLGISYEVVRVTGLFERLGEPEDVLITLVSILCAALGIQRLVNLEEISRRSRNIEEILNNEILASLRGDPDALDDVTIFFGQKAIKNAAIAMIEECNDGEHLKATGQFFPDSKSAGLPDDYFRSVADRIKRANNRGGSGMVYEIIIPAEPAELRDASEKKRREAFRQAGVEDKLIIKYTSRTFPIETLICDHAVILAFPGISKTKTYELGLRINNRQFRNSFEDWFQRYEWEKAAETVGA